MAEMWYYTCEGKQMEPVSIKELKGLVGDGVLKPTDMIWKDGLPRWIRASSLKELFPDPATALDHYFLHAKDAPVAVAASSDTSTPAPVASRASNSDEAEPRTQKKRRRSSDEDDDRPRRRRAEANRGGAGVGIMIAWIAGAAIIVGSLAVGVVILIVMDGPRPPRAAPGFAIQAMPPVEIFPAPEPNPIANPKPNELVNGVLTYTTPPVPVGDLNGRMVSVRKGVTYEISARGDLRLPSTSVTIFDRNNVRQDLDPQPPPDSSWRWSPLEEGEYRLEVRRLMGPPTPITVTIRETNLPIPVAKNGPPLPPGVKAGRGSWSIPVMLLPGQEHFVKFRIKASYNAKISVTPSPLKNANLNLYAFKDEDDTLIIADETPAPSARVAFIREITDIVRVRVHNASKTAIVNRLTFVYDVGN